MRNTSWIVLLALASAPAFAQEKTIEPGLYELTTKPSEGPATTSNVCLTAKDIADSLNPVMDKDCKRVRNSVGGGKLDFATSCKEMTMTATGTYTSTSYVIDGKIVLKGDEPMTITTRATGKRIAATCKPG